MWAGSRLDHGIVNRLHSFAVHHPAWVTSWRVVTDIGQPDTWRALGAIAAVWLLWRRRIRPAAFVILLLLGSVVLSTVLKEIVRRHRPVVPHPVAHASSWSFPSGHALSAGLAAAAVIVLARLISRRGLRIAATVAAVVVALAVGFSRIALGVHYPSDVLAGWLLATIWVLISLRLALHLRRAPGEPREW